MSTPSSMWYTLSNGSAAYPLAWIETEAPCCRHCVWSLDYPLVNPIVLATDRTVNPSAQYLDCSQFEVPRVSPVLDDAAAANLNPHPRAIVARLPQPGPVGALRRAGSGGDRAVPHRRHQRVPLAAGPAQPLPVIRPGRHRRQRRSLPARVVRCRRETDRRIPARRAPAATFKGVRALCSAAARRRVAQHGGGLRARCTRSLF